MKALRRLGKFIAPIIAAAGLAVSSVREAKAQEYTNAVVNNITNNMQLTWNWTDVYQVQAGSADQSQGAVIGNTNDWVDAGTNVNLEAIAGTYYDFSHWANCPAGKELQNPLNYANDTPRTNITAYFTPKLASNGTPLWWLDGIYGLGTNDNVDSDNDGLKNWQEYIAGTDPTNNASYFSIGNIQQGNSIELEINPSFTSRVYYVDGRDSLTSGSWTEITNSSGNGSNLVFHLPDYTNETKFYRTRVEKP